MARFGLIVILMFALLTQSIETHAQESQERPKVGLALSGGGARGGAHIGVLRALEELDIHIDYIAGTSMGAIVGGFYAAGYSADEIEQIMLDMDWTAAFSDRPDRRDETMRKKQLEAAFPIPYRLGFNNGGVQLPLGVVEGQHLDQIFQRILLPARGITNFDRLTIPFRAVATDLVTGKEVVLSHGSLADALRASMSVPGVFAPVRINDRLLVDGGMANNLPVSVVREMGADIVIAVDISAPFLDEEELTSVFSVTEQLTNFLTRNNMELQIASLGQEDILFVPDLQGFSSADFERGQELVEIGYQTVMTRQPELVSLPSAQPRTAVDPVVEGAPVGFIVSFVELNNTSVLSDEIILSRIDIPLGERLDLAALNQMVDQVYSLDVFESVSYDFTQNKAGETGLVINAIPRSWGPNYLQFGVEFADDFSGSNDFKLGAAYTRNALNSLGGELRVTAAIGREDELSFDFYQPIDKQARWFVEPEVFLQRQQYSVWEGETRLAILDIAGGGARLGFGRNFSTTNLIRLNYEYMKGKQDYLAGELPPELQDEYNENVDIGELQLEFRHDSLDSLWFPSRGTFHRIGYRYAAEALGAASDYHQFEAIGGFTYTRSKNTFLLNYELGYSVDDKAPVERWFELGGLGRLSGLVPDQLSGRQLGLLTLAYHRRLNEIDLLPAYAGVSLEAGNVWYRADEVSFGDLRLSGSIFVGARTPLGPVYLAWGHSDNGESTIYFYLGNPFRRSQF